MRSSGRSNGRSTSGAGCLCLNRRSGDNHGEMTQRTILPSDVVFVAGVALLGVVSLLVMAGAIPAVAALITHLVGFPLVIGYAFFIRRRRDAEAAVANGGATSRQRQKRYVVLLAVVAVMTLLQLLRFTGFSARAGWSLLAAAALGGGFWLWFWIRGDA